MTLLRPLRQSMSCRGLVPPMLVLTVALTMAPAPGLADGDRGRGHGNDHGRSDQAPGRAGRDVDEGGESPVIGVDDSFAGSAAMAGPSEPASAYGVPDAPTGRAAPAPASPPASAQASPPAAAPPAPTAVPSAEAPAPAVSPLPVVVELFTAQGCSTCPPADALLGDLVGQPGVLPLSFHVDYWNYLGWTDAFSRPEFTARQKAYGRGTGERGVYTPQIIVAGNDTLIDVAPAGLESLIDGYRGRRGAAAVAVARTNGGRRLMLSAAEGRAAGPAEVTLVRFVPRRDVRITAGENRGRTVAYSNVVVSIEALGRWDGRSPLALGLPARPAGLPDDTRAAVLVQRIARRGGLGPIVGALALD